MTVENIMLASDPYSLIDLGWGPEGESRQ